jgi:carboxymethylenebutenolidase
MPDIQISALDGTIFGAYCALPPGGHGPGMIVIQEIFGVNANMRRICDEYAAKGYIAVCPDLFRRQEPGVQLTDKTKEEWDHAFALYKGFDVEAGVRDLFSTMAHIRQMPGCSGKVGAVGFCLGGKLAYLMATRSDVDAAVGYYAAGLEDKLDEVQDIRMPTMMHMAELDKFMPPDVRNKVLRAFGRNPTIVAHVYPGVDHAFARIGGEHFDADAAKLANERTEALFKKYLQDVKK